MTRSSRWRLRIFKAASFLFLATFMLAGCSDFCLSAHPIDVDKIAWIEVKKVPTGGDSETAIANSRYAQLAGWLGENRCGWEKYYVTLPAPEIIVGSSDFFLYVTKNSVFLSQQDETTLVKTLTDSEAQSFCDTLFSSDR